MNMETNMTKQLNKEELCEALAEDYADKATRGGLSYNSAYTHYLDRCFKRKFKDLVIQYTVQGLGRIKTNNTKKHTYIT